MPHAFNHDHCLPWVSEPATAPVPSQSARRSIATRYALTGRAMFLSARSPISSKARSSLPTASSCTRAETQIPPGSASAFRRAATLIPSPKMSPSSTTTSPIDAKRGYAVGDAHRRAVARASRCARTPPAPVIPSQTDSWPIVLAIRLRRRVWSSPGGSSKRHPPQTSPRCHPGRH